VRRTEQIRSEFVANASHELKTPLTAIKGFAELIRSGMIKNPQKESEYLSLICSETERMIDLINDILHLSELESISEDTGESNVSLLAIAEKVRESLSIQAEGKDVTVTVSGDAGILNANPDRLTQLVLNLLDNAIKYNRSGGSVSVIVRQLRNAVTLTVSDTGIGIPPEAKDRVFERFYRVDKSRSRKIGGTGLGLSIVKHIVSLYHGRIDLKSEVGKGTVIEVTIPSGMHPAPPRGD
jgi:two-component system phosphate regulon sensor histidine kinase PhoR